MRSLRVSFMALAIAMLPSTAPAQAPDPAADSVLSVSSTQDPLAATPISSVQADRGDSQVPSSERPSFPMEVVGLAALATAKKTRRSSGKRGDVPMYLDSNVDVIREGKDGKEHTTRIAGGVLVDDTDLTDDEIDELTARKVIRPAKPEEIERLEKGDTAAERDALVREQEQELAQLRAKHEAARAELGDKASPAKITALETKQGEEVAKLQAAHTKALNALAE